MTQAQAQLLAERVRRALRGDVEVLREGHYFVVAVAATDGSHVLRDEPDWDWLRRRVRG